MGKRQKGTAKGDTVVGPGNLSSQIATDSLAKDRQVPRQKKKRKNNAALDDEQLGQQEQFVSDKLSQKILREAAIQQQEIEAELNGTSSTTQNKKPKLGGRQKRPSLSALRDDSDAEDNDDETDRRLLDDLEDSYNQAAEEIQLDGETEAAFNKFLLPSAASGGSERQKTLYDLIQEKIEDKKTEVAKDMHVRELDDRFVEMYRGVRDVLSTYRAGKLPKAFKIIPKFINWEQVLSITEPDKWTAAAMFAGTRIFVSNLNADLCQKFLNLVLLPRVRDDIAEYGRLNFHLYQALHKALFKPAAFFKGILIPLCESGSCSLREATIISSVLAKSSIPMLHAAAAMLKLADMDYSGGNSMFLRMLLDKKYTLPYRVIDGLVDHFIRFTHDKRELPVLWHQALLVFVQRYKSDMSAEQREAIAELLKAQVHHQITPEVRRELQHTQPRDVEDVSQAMEP